MPGFELGQTDQRHRVLGLLRPSALLHLSELRLPARQGDTLFVRIWVFISICHTAFLQLSEPGLPARYDGHSFNGPDLCICHFTLPGNLSIPCQVTFLYLAGCLSVPGRFPFYTWQIAFLYLSALCFSIPGRLPFYT